MVSSVHPKLWATLQLSAAVVWLTATRSQCSLRSVCGGLALLGIDISSAGIQRDRQWPSSEQPFQQQRQPVRDQYIEPDHVNCNQYDVSDQAEEDDLQG